MSFNKIKKLCKERNYKKQNKSSGCEPFEHSEDLEEKKSVNDEAKSIYYFYSK